MVDVPGESLSPPPPDHRCLLPALEHPAEVLGRRLLAKGVEVESLITITRARSVRVECSRRLLGENKIIFLALVSWEFPVGSAPCP